MKIGFVHIAKSGGNTIERIIKEKYSSNFLYPSWGHAHENSHYPYSFAIVREPLERFLSSYFYWKHGSKDTTWIRNSNWNPKAKNFNEFMYYWDKKDSEFLSQLDFQYSKITYLKWHFSSQKKWLHDSFNKNTIILKYSDNIDAQFTKLLNYLNIEKKSEVKKINITKTKDEDIDLDIVNKWFNINFKEDIKLWNDIQNKQTKFMKVII